ncbi:hypothetical protein BK004_04555 [bacterium CG10_46_32]|nr:MAG: hypothetical protein BK004_04555 [bacterium CG10_46_32]PIR55713.1 MAG: hypothetical protein COU73_04595 [Parcubacteria group bacterium CG10_big_fil_rev_8_21_14_0_10_46_32]
MTHAIIGARGDMGKNLLSPLLKHHGDVVEVNRGDPQDVWDRAWQADYIWLSVPRDAVPQLLDSKTFAPEQVIVDICSIKRNLSAVIQKTGATHLSLHQLHGPFVPLNGQKWAHIKTSTGTDTHPRVQSLLAFLKEQGISFLHAESEEEHDFMIGLTLSLPEMSTVFLDTLIDQYSKDAGRATPSMAKLMEWAVPASNVLFGYYIHSINSSADWLRKDLIMGAHADLLASARAASSRLAHLEASDIEQRLTVQREFVESLPQAERKRVRQWIERWFVDSVQKIFAFHQSKSIKPKLVLQECADAKIVFPTHKGTVSVGVHGIAGSFTHESVLRLAEELDVPVEKLDVHYLVEADKVIGAVVRGDVDRGVFAMANSGSGAYVSSMHAMAEQTFDVLAVYGMEILQCLIAHPSVTSIEDITEVFGHPQAVSQCKRTFEEKYPRIALRYGEDSDDTALCVKRIADGELPRTTATLASQVAAGLYKMNILEYGMHHDPFNTTTFLVIGNKR